MAEVAVPIYMMPDNQMPGFYEGFATLGDEADPVASIGVGLAGRAFYIFLHKEPQGTRGASRVAVIRASEIVEKALAKLAAVFPSLRAPSSVGSAHEIAADGDPHGASGPKA